MQRNYQMTHLLVKLHIVLPVVSLSSVAIIATVRLSLYSCFERQWQCLHHVHNIINTFPVHNILNKGNKANKQTRKETKSKHRFDIASTRKR